MSFTLIAYLNDSTNESCKVNAIWARVCLGLFHSASSVYKGYFKKGNIHTRNTCNQRSAFNFNLSFLTYVPKRDQLNIRKKIRRLEMK